MLCPSCIPKNKRSLFTYIGGRGGISKLWGHCTHIKCHVVFTSNSDFSPTEERQHFVFCLLKKCKWMISKGVRRSNKLYKMKKKDALSKKHIKALVQSFSYLFHRSIRRDKKSVFICHKYWFCLGSSSPETGGLMLLDALHEMWSSWWIP